MAIVSYALAADRLRSGDIVSDPYKRKYKWLIEATGEDEDLDDAVLTIIRIRMESPLLIELASKKLVQRIQQAFAQSFRYIINHLLFIDLEREKRSVEIQMMREQVLEQRIKNASSALNLVKKIPNKQLREEFIDSLRSSVFPFAIEHPPIKSIQLIEDADEKDTNETDEKMIDEVDDDSKPN